MKSAKNGYKNSVEWKSPVVFAHLRTQLTNALEQTETGESKTQCLTHMVRDEEDKARFFPPCSSSSHAHHTPESSNTTHHQTWTMRYCNYTRLAPGFTCGVVHSENTKPTKGDVERGTPTAAICRVAPNWGVEKQLYQRALLNKRLIKGPNDGHSNIIISNKKTVVVAGKPDFGVGWDQVQIIIRSHWVIINLSFGAFISVTMCGCPPRMFT